MGRGGVFTTIGLGAFLAFGLAAASAANETIEHNYDALGRLIISQSEGTVNDEETRSLCYDAAGNRTKFVSDDAAAVASCAPSFAPMPSPSPISASSNTAPTASADSISISKTASPTSIDVLANDSDTDGDLPLALTGATLISGGASIELISSSEILVTPAASNGTSIANYQVTDARGAVSTGTLTILTTN